MNINDLMKQAQGMQQQMQQMQAEAVKAEVTGESGAGMVQVVMNGRHDAYRRANTVPRGAAAVLFGQHPRPRPERGHCRDPHAPAS